MALSRKYLQGMGLTAEQVTAIIEANEETINGLKDEIEKYKSASEDSGKKLSKVQKELDSIKEEAENGKSPYKVKYEALKEEMEKLQKQYNDYKADVDAKEIKSKKAEAYKKLLKETGVSEKRIDAVLRVTDINSLEFDEEGKLKNVDELVKNIKSEWNDFIATESTQGAVTSTPPANNGGKKMTRADIYKKDEHGRYVLSTAERQKALMDISTNKI